MNKIVIITNSHRPDDSRVYQKIAVSLAKKYDITIIHTSAIKMENSQNIHFITCPTVRKYEFIRFCLKTIKKEKSDLLICVEPFTLLIGNIAKLLFKIPFIYDCHEFFAEAFTEKHSYAKPISYLTYRAVEILLYKNANGVVTVNQILVNLLKKSNPNTIACGNYPLTHSPGKKGESKEYDLIYTGGISRYRGLDLMLKLVEYFKKENNPLRLLILGKFLNHSEESYAFSKIKESGLEGYVEIKSHVSSHLVPEYLSKAKIGLSILNPAVSRYHNAIPLKLLEYMQQGLPVIANNFPILREIITKNQCGLCVQYDLQMIIPAVRELLDKKEIYETYSYNAKKLVETEYNWQNEEPKLFSLIHGIINEH